MAEFYSEIQLSAVRIVHAIDWLIVSELGNFKVVLSRVAPFQGREAEGRRPSESTGADGYLRIFRHEYCWLVSTFCLPIAFLVLPDPIRVNE